MSRNKHSLEKLEIPKFLIERNAILENLRELKTNFKHIPFKNFEFNKILTLLPSLKILKINCVDMNSNVKNNLIENYEKHFIISRGKPVSFPVRMIHCSDFQQLVTKCTFKHKVEYISIGLKMGDPEITAWDNFVNCFHDFSNLKGINFYDYYASEYDFEEKHFFEKFPHLGNTVDETFYAIWPDRVNFLKQNNIKFLTSTEFKSKIQILSESLDWIFQFDLWCEWPSYGDFIPE
jgi:hypothetical protein